MGTVKVEPKSELVGRDFYVPESLRSAAFHVNDDNGLVAPLRAQIESLTGPFKVVNGGIKADSGKIYTVKIDAKAFKITVFE